jgi:hypothetical protein
MDHKQVDSDCQDCQEHNHTITEEFLCHMPYTGVSLAFGFLLLSLLQFVAGDNVPPEKYHILFHVFHYLHVVFAVMGTTLAYFRHARNVFVGIILSLCVPITFCVLSDSILPSLAGTLLGIPMHIHICFMHMHDAINLIILMFMGLIMGYALTRVRQSLSIFSFGSHFIHIFLSSLASLFYTLGHGFTDWYDNVGILFGVLFVCVVVPCTLSDVVVPMYVARFGFARK